MLQLVFKDAAAKRLLVPFIGTGLAVAVGWYSFHEQPLYSFVLSILFWIIITFFVWQATVQISIFVRTYHLLQRSLNVRLVALFFTTLLFALLVGAITSRVWYKLFQNLIVADARPGFAYLYLAISPVIALVYEIFFLKKELHLNSKIVSQLDYERQSAELQALNYEFDSHFVFNALNVLLPLITTDSGKAHIFTRRLSQVYKYLLQNREHERVSLQEELNFIDDYFFLLQIRHENKLQLEIKLEEFELDEIQILPFALQVLVENAIKHNHFSEEQPLVITITVHKQFLQLSNSVNPKPFVVESTNVGLKNLRSRYKLIGNKDVIIYHTAKQYIVRLPLLKSAV